MAVLEGGEQALDTSAEGKRSKKKKKKEEGGMKRKQENERKKEKRKKEKQYRRWQTQLRGMDGTGEVLPGPAPSPQRLFLHRVGLPQPLTAGFPCTQSRDGAFPRNTTEGESPPRPPTPLSSQGQAALRRL